MPLVLAELIVGPTAIASGAYAARWHHRVVSESPPATSFGQMVYDSARQRMILFGGRWSDEVYTGDTWSWDGERWGLLSTTGPAARLGHALAYDPVRDQVVLFGGADAGERWFGDTWVLSGDHWTQLAPPTSPPGNVNHAMAFDPVSQTVIEFGGRQEGGATWSWDGTTWTQLHPTHSPPAREATALVLDPSRGALVLYGGYGGGAYRDDTWVWNGADWTEETLRESPPARGQQMMSTFGRHVATFGGQTSGDRTAVWILRKHTWRMTRPYPWPIARVGAMFAWDAAREEAVLFGGYSFGDEADDTWTLRRSEFVGRVGLEPTTEGL